MGTIRLYLLSFDIYIIQRSVNNNDGYYSTNAITDFEFP